MNDSYCEFRRTRIPQFIHCLVPQYVLSRTHNSVSSRVFSPISGDDCVNWYRHSALILLISKNASPRALLRRLWCRLVRFKMADAVLKPISISALLPLAKSPWTLCFLFDYHSFPLSYSFSQDINSYRPALNLSTCMHSSIPPTTRKHSVIFPPESNTKSHEPLQHV